MRDVGAERNVPKIEGSGPTVQRMAKIVKKVLRAVLAPFVRLVAEILVTRAPGTFASALRRTARKKIFPEPELVITRGLFSNVRMLPLSWNSSDWVSIATGQYEKEVQEWIQKNLKVADRDVLVIGAGDGLYGLGLFQAQLGTRVFCFERNRVSRNRLLSNWALNRFPPGDLRLGGKFIRLGDHPELSDFRRDGAFFVMDIEGGEFSVIDNEFLIDFANASGVIEVHASGEEDLKTLEQTLSGVFRVTILKSGPRNPSQISELSGLTDDLRWSVMSEGRQIEGVWFAVAPK